MDEFLALRRAAAEEPAATRDLHESEVCSIEMERQPHVVPNSRPSGLAVPFTGIDEQRLTSYFVDLLAAHPSARPVKDRLGLAQYLARGIAHRYPDHERTALWNETLIRRTPDKEACVARCPAGHETDEVMESRQVMGWACQVCQRVYDATECQLLPRGAASHTKVLE